METNGSLQDYKWVSDKRANMSKYNIYMFSAPAL